MRQRIVIVVLGVVIGLLAKWIFGEPNSRPLRRPTANSAQAATEKEPPAANHGARP